MSFHWCRPSSSSKRTYLVAITLLRTSAALLGRSFVVQARKPTFFKVITTLSQQLSSSTTSTTSTTTSSTSMPGSSSTTTPTPPVARRDEDRVIYAGVAPEGWKADLPRQSESSTETLLDPPVAVPDPYGWLRDDKREQPAVLEHLKAENEYTEALTSHLSNLREKLYQEMLRAIQETDYSTPRPDGAYYYYTRTMEGQSYTVHCRAPKTTATSTSTTSGNEKLSVKWDGSKESVILPNEQVLLDVNELAVGQSYCSTGTVRHSPSHKLLAYSTDLIGGETCHMYVKDIASNQMVFEDDKIEMNGSICWGADDTTIFYLKMDAAHRPFQVYRKRLLLQDSNDDMTARDDGDDELLLEEMDDLYWMGISKSLDGNYLFVEVSSKEQSEIHYLNMHDPTAKLECIAKRRHKVLYEVEHREGQWWIASNVGDLPNMALFSCPASSDCHNDWALVKDPTGTPLFAGDLTKSLDGVTCFKNHVVLSGRQDGLPRVWVAPMNDDKVLSMDRLAFAEEAHDVGVGVHREYNTSTLVVSYDSLVTPTQSLEINLNDPSDRIVLKERAVPGYDKDLYACERTTVASRDGSVEIPVSLVYRKDVMEQHAANGAPVHTHLYGYGSYGSCVEADFRSTRLPLLNRGVVYAIAHVRGGAEMGRQWYEEPNGAKYLCKKNTFDDFVDVAQWLIKDRKLTAPDLLSCEGRSAGGLLIGSSINQAPELFKMAVLGVPFVDVVCTMVDASIPLTAIEWEEWGNPNEGKYHDYMKTYCPMQTVKEAKYPSCLLTGGLHDPRVAYWEPAKFAATLRHTQNSESGPVCVKMDMTAGHFSASDRYKYLKELAFDYAFLLDQVGLVDRETSS